MFPVLSWILVRPRDRLVLHFFFTVLDVTNAFVETCFPPQLQLPLRFPPAHMIVEITTHSTCGVQT